MIVASCMSLCLFVFVGVDGECCLNVADEFREFFSTFGEVKEHQIMRDHSTNRSRGFGFITFDSEEMVDELLSKGNKIDFAGAQVSGMPAQNLPFISWSYPFCLKTIAVS